MGFKNEEGTTVGIDESSVTTTTTYKAQLYKSGPSDGWTTITLPVPITKGKYEIDLEVIASLHSHIMLGFAKDGVNLKNGHAGQVASSWSYFFANGMKYTEGNAVPWGPRISAGDHFTMKFSFEAPTVLLYKNGAPFGTMADIPFQNTDLRFCVSLHHIGDYCGISVSVTV